MFLSLSLVLVFDLKIIPRKEFDYSYDSLNELFKVEARYLDIQELTDDPLALTIDNYLREQIFSDSLGRIIQKKSESVVDGTKCWVVSSKKEYDSMEIQHSPN